MYVVDMRESSSLWIPTPVERVAILRPEVLKRAALKSAR
jgi:hypothetical protein